MKILDKIVISPTPPSSKNVAWFDGKGIKIPNQGEWKNTGGSSGGSGIEIVESVDKLDPNAPVGSLASVAVPGKITEASVRDIQQPDASIIDQTDGTIITANLNTVTSVSIDPSKVSFDGRDTMLYFCTENVKMMGADSNGIVLAITTATQGAQGGVYINTSTYEQKVYTFIQKDAEGTITIYQDQIDEFIKHFEDNTFYYLGFLELMTQRIEITEEDYISLDNIKVVSGIPSVVNVYLKGDKWELLNGKDLNSLKSSIDRNTKALEGKLDIVTREGYSSYKGINPNVYTIYSNYGSDSIDFILNSVQDTNRYNEYIIEFQCNYTPSSVTFKNQDGTELIIKWANSMPPVFEAGYTYLISIVNNFGVFAKYINS